MDLPDELGLIHQPTRLRIMGILYKHRDVAFTWVRDQLSLTDGNLASHAGRLEDAGFLEGREALTGDGFEKRYRITEAGSEAFRRYVTELKGFLETVDEGAEAGGLAPASAEASKEGAGRSGRDGGGA